jgi:hypothetical protein
VSLTKFSCMCPTIYRWSQRSVEMPVSIYAATSGFTKEVEEHISVFYRVDIIEPPPVPSNNRAEGSTIWYCSECGDGPYGGWHDHCVICNYVRCKSCIEEEYIARHT